MPLIAPPTITPAAEGYLERLAEELDVPPSRYEAAERSYHAVGDWLDREDSSLKHYSPKVYIQGSFRLGTAIRPINDEEDYDVDLVCELDVTKAVVTQIELKQMVAVELKSYTNAHSMQPPTEGRRCWTLNYADGAQFHLDALPAIPDQAGKKLLLEARGLDSSWVNTALAITDNEHPAYRIPSTNWPHSNPKGFTNWFRSRMNQVFEARRNAMALAVKASVEDIPEYTVKTPLQAAVQILKRHRDLMFADMPDDKPISIIITTLAALSYTNEASVAKAMDTILNGMERHVQERNGVKWIANPTDPEENFADRWQKYPQRYEAFRNWLSAARRDFSNLTSQTRRELLVKEAAAWAGDAVAKRAATQLLVERKLSPATLFRSAASALFAPHRKPAPWPVVKQGSVVIERAILSRNGFRCQSFLSNSSPLPKGASLTFRAKTDVPEPYQVHWQVVNTGDEAIASNSLRGGFETGTVERGSIVRSEGTKYKGSHTIECLIIKDGYLVARSGVFVVNIS